MVAIKSFTVHVTLNNAHDQHKDFWLKLTASYDLGYLSSKLGPISLPDLKSEQLTEPYELLHISPERQTQSDNYQVKNLLQTLTSSIEEGNTLIFDFFNPNKQSQ